MTEPTPPLLFSPSLTRLRQRRAEPARADFLHQASLDILQDNLADVNREFPELALIGEAGQALAERLGRSDATVIPSTPGFSETLALAMASQQAVLGIGGLHRANDVPGLLAQAFHALEPDGLLMWVFPGGESLKELRHALLTAEMQLTGGASQRVHPFIDVRDAGGLLQRAGFALPIVDKVTITATYAHLFDLIRDLRWMGETNLLTRQAKTIPPKRLFPLAAEIYQQQFALPEGRIPARFELITLIGWKPHASQPKPARRGSGKMGLGEVL